PPACIFRSAPLPSFLLSSRLPPRLTHSPLLFLLPVPPPSALYTLSLHDALPISVPFHQPEDVLRHRGAAGRRPAEHRRLAARFRSGSVAPPLLQFPGRHQEARRPAREEGYHL